MTDNNSTTTGHTRRTVVRGAAWSVPSIVVMSATAPAFATSPVAPDFGKLEVCKLPGRSTDIAYGYLFRVPYTGDDSQLDIDTISLNGNQYMAECQKSVQGGSTNYYEWVVKSTNSADGSGTAVIVYTFQGMTDTVTLQYDGTKPCKGDISGVCK